MSVGSGMYNTADAVASNIFGFLNNACEMQMIEDRNDLFAKKHGLSREDYNLENYHRVAFTSKEDMELYRNAMSTEGIKTVATEHKQFGYYYAEFEKGAMADSGVSAYDIEKRIIEQTQIQAEYVNIVNERPIDIDYEYEKSDAMAHTVTSTFTGNADGYNEIRNSMAVKLYSTISNWANGYGTENGTDIFNRKMDGTGKIDDSFKSLTSQKAIVIGDSYTGYTVIINGKVAEGRAREEVLQKHYDRLDKAMEIREKASKSYNQGLEQGLISSGNSVGKTGRNLKNSVDPIEFSNWEYKAYKTLDWGNENTASNVLGSVEVKTPVQAVKDATKSVAQGVATTVVNTPNIANNIAKDVATAVVNAPQNVVIKGVGGSMQFTGAVMSGVGSYMERGYKLNAQKSLADKIYDNSQYQEYEYSSHKSKDVNLNKFDANKEVGAFGWQKTGVAVGTGFCFWSKGDLTNIVNEVVTTSLIRETIGKREKSSIIDNDELLDKIQQNGFLDDILNSKTFAHLQLDPKLMFTEANLIDINKAFLTKATQLAHQTNSLDFAFIKSNGKFDIEKLKKLNAEQLKMLGISSETRDILVRVNEKGSWGLTSDRFKPATKTMGLMGRFAMSQDDELARDLGNMQRGVKYGQKAYKTMRKGTTAVSKNIERKLGMRDKDGNLIKKNKDKKNKPKKEPTQKQLDKVGLDHEKHIQKQERLLKKVEKKQNSLVAKASKKAEALKKKIADSKLVKAMQKVSEAITRAVMSILKYVAIAVVGVWLCMMIFIIIYMTIQSFLDFNPQQFVNGVLAPQTVKDTIAYKLYEGLDDREDEWLDEIVQAKNVLSLDFDVNGGNGALNGMNYINIKYGTNYEMYHQYIPKNNVSVVSKTYNYNGTTRAGLFTTLFNKANLYTALNDTTAIAFMEKYTSAHTGYGTVDYRITTNSNKYTYNDDGGAENGHTSNIKDILCMVDVMYANDITHFGDSEMTSILGDTYAQVEWNSFCQRVKDALKWIGSIFSTEDENAEPLIYANCPNHKTIRLYAYTLFTSSHQMVFDMSTDFYDVDALYIKNNHTGTSTAVTNSQLLHYNGVCSSPDYSYFKIGSPNNNLNNIQPYADINSSNIKIYLNDTHFVNAKIDMSCLNQYEKVCLYNTYGDNSYTYEELKKRLYNGNKYNDRFGTVTLDKEGQGENATNDKACWFVVDSETSQTAFKHTYTYEVEETWTNTTEEEKNKKDNTLQAKKNAYAQIKNLTWYGKLKSASQSYGSTVYDLSDTLDKFIYGNVSIKDKNLENYNNNDVYKVERTQVGTPTTTTTNATYKGICSGICHENTSNEENDCWCDDKTCTDCYELTSQAVTTNKCKYKYKVTYDNGSIDSIAFKRDCKGHQFKYCGGHISLVVTGVVYSFTNEQLATVGGIQDLVVKHFLDNREAMGYGKLIGKVDKESLNYADVRTETHINNNILAGTGLVATYYKNIVSLSKSGKGLNPETNVQGCYSSMNGINLWVDNGNWSRNTAGMNILAQGFDVNNRLTDVYKDLFEIDTSIKKGALVFPYHSIEDTNVKLWTAENMEMALIKYSMDWESVYGFDIPSEISGKIVTVQNKPNEATQTTQKALTNGDINAVIEGLKNHYGSLLTDTRIKAVETVLSYVGKGHYIEGGHSHDFLDDYCYGNQKYYLQRDGAITEYKPYALSCTATDDVGFANFIYKKFNKITNHKDSFYTGVPIGNWDYVALPCDIISHKGGKAGNTIGLPNSLYNYVANGQSVINEEIMMLLGYTTAEDRTIIYIGQLDEDITLSSEQVLKKDTDIFVDVQKGFVGGMITLHGENTITVGGYNYGYNWTNFKSSVDTSLYRFE